ncbi:MAG TPA: hypothetical protein DIC34_19375 [Treponema sp.]|nr:MAG: hypothetical protein A2Y36_01180 [Treponema sp. GWA1_62_8]OHE68822.1 MAG: hypothetical protein A2001_20875 [Treponema sp. GWC1_61_84]HCM28662.1 hypothetical protein [Treponema sp.]
MRTMSVVSTLIVVTIFSFGVVVSGAEFPWYFDVPSLVVILLPAFFLAAADHSWQTVGRAFSSAFGRKPRGAADKASYAAELLAAKALGRYAWLSALLGTFIGFVAILASLGQVPSTGILGRNVSVGLLCAFTATCFELIVVSPLKGRLEKLLLDAEDTQDASL